MKTITKNLLAFSIGLVVLTGYSGDVDPLFRDIDPLSGKRFNEQSL
jgi:hypothetical protein